MASTCITRARARARRAAQDETFEMVRQFVPAHDVTFNARGSLVKRLDGYCRKYKETVQEVLDLLNREFKFIISRQARVVARGGAAAAAAAATLPPPRLLLLPLRWCVRAL